MTAPMRNCLDFLRLWERERWAAINAAVSASELRASCFFSVLFSLQDQDECGHG
jgi:hypothetical protein